MDIVAYSRLPTDEQRRVLSILQNVVRGSEEFRNSESRTHLLCLPTGDGMVLAFFEEPEAPVRCAIELSVALRQHPEVKIRMGIHAGPVYRIEDINLSRNVAGGGVNIAQRVMDCGDAGHILVSSSAAEYLRQVTRWSGALHDLGDAVVKHSEHIHLYNFYSTDIGNPSVPSKIRMAKRKREFNKMLVVVLIGAATVALAVSCMYFYGKFGPRKTVAVLDLKNKSGVPELAWIGDQFSDELSAELGKNDKLRLISRDRVIQTNRDLSFVAGAPLAMVLPTLRKDLAVDLIVSGSYWDTSDLVRVELRVQDTVSGKIITQWSGSELEGKVDQLAVEASRNLVRHLGVRAGIRDKFRYGDEADNDPKYPETRKLLAMGQRFLRDFDAVQAKETLLSASSIEPNSFRVHAALGDAWSAIGYRDAARNEFKKAYALSSGMPEKQRLIIAARLSEASDQPEMAASDYGTLFVQFPDDVDIGLGLATARIKASRPADAMETIGRLRQLTPPSRDDPRIDLVEAEAEEIVSKYSAMQSSAVAAIKKADGQHMIQARGEELEGIALRRLGRPKEAIDALSTAWSSYQAAGDRLGATTALLHIGKIRRDTGDLKEAERIFKTCSVAYQEVGNKASEAESLNMIGLTLWDKGNLERAKTVFLHGIELSDSIGDKLLSANMLGNLGSVLYGTGDLDSPEAYHQRSIELYSLLGDTDHRANELNNLGNLYHDRGELDAARSMHEQAITLANKSGQKKTLAGALSAYGELLTDMGELTMARKQHEAAFTIWTDIKDPLDAAYDQVALAGLNVEEGKIDGVESVTRSAIATFKEAEESDKAIVAETILIRCLILEHRISDAQKEIRRATTLMSGNQLPYAKYEFAIVAAMVDSKSGNVGKALKGLRQLISQLEKTHYVCYRLRATLLLDELQLHGKKSDEARADLRRVQEEANRKGLGLIARQAAAVGGENSSQQ
jgi:tetratricopeptide (TPR) repeat protein